MIRTAEQYVESLKDGRKLYFLGERISDVTKHPILATNVASAAMDWVLANDPQYRDLLTFEQDGDRVMFLWKQPKTAEDLVKRRDIFITTNRINMTTGGSTLHAMGVDALAAATVVASRIDRELNTNYLEAVEDYRHHCMTNDPGITGAITDVKGDRSLRPSKQLQHNDFYVRVVDKQKDGIVVRGAKMHITSAPVANEIIVSPCRTHQEEDKDYAVVFATPLNAEGITQVVSPPGTTKIGEEAAWDWPISGRRGGATESLIVFDDVFVPWNRVFMCGEWEYTRDMAWAFGTFHRIYGTAHTVANLEVKAGAAALVAEYNGLDKYWHIREKLAWLAMHAEMCDAISRAACEHPQMEIETGYAVPNMVFSNIAKYKFANDAAESSKYLGDICGGLAYDAFSYIDWNNPDERIHLERYLAGKNGVPTEHRLKAIRLVKDLTGLNHDQKDIHAEGSLAAQTMAIYAGADWERYKAAAKRIAGIPGWEFHTLFEKLPDYPPKKLV